MTDGRKHRGKLERDDPVLGRVRLCTWCGEEWPLDEEFFYFTKGKVQSGCRACWGERSLTLWRTSA